MNSAQQRMINWVKQNDPFLYDVAMKNYQMKTANSGLNGVFDNFDFGKFVGSLTSAAAKVANQAANIKVLNENIKRAKQGIPPITTDAYQPSNPYYSPNTPEGQYAVNYTARSLAPSSFNVTSLLPWAAIGLVGFMLVKKARS
jgi:hypothetical protein